MTINIHITILRRILGPGLAGVVLFVSLLQSAVLYAQEPLFTNRATEMRAAPDDAAKVVRALPEKSTVQQLQRKGAWTMVQFTTGTDKSPVKETGWVRMMHLRGGVVVVDSPSSSSSGGGFMSSFNRLLSGNSGRSSTQAQNATVGIRGLSPEELKTASPDAAALAKMNSYKSEKPEAERFAKEAKLAKADVPELNDAARGRK